MRFKIDIKKSIWVILAALIFALILYVKNNVVIMSFEQLLFGVMKLKGSGVSAVGYGVLYVIISFLIICSLLLLPVVDFGKKIIIIIKEKYIQLYPVINIKKYGIILFVIGIVILLYMSGIFLYIKNTFFDNTEIFDDYYVDGTKVDISFPGEKRNLIYIFAESLENSNVSIENGGLFEESVIPKLEGLALDNINFSNNDKIGGAYYSYGTNWTSGAMIAHTSGVPLKVMFNDFSPNSIRLNNVTSIGDILSDNGYNNYLLLGSDADFGSRRSYFSNHNYAIYDYYSAIEEGKIDSDYYVWWGYEDAKLFEYAKDKILDISNDDKPFNFTLLTVDTHFTDGYVDASCEEKFGEPYADAIYCSDDKIYEFITWVKEQEFYEDTTIVVVGDHLTMQNGFYDIDFRERTIYNVFINTSISEGYNNKNRVFTVMDLFPTTLASIGANIEGNRIGLGTNLFSDIDTIPEMIGIDKFNDEISKGSHYYYNKIRG